MSEPIVTFVAVCPNYWGAGDSAEKAIKMAKLAGARRYKKPNFTVYRIEAAKEDIEIDGVDGTVMYPKGTKAEKVQTSDLAKAVEG